MWPVEDAGNDAIVVDAEPGTAGKLIHARDNIGPVTPVSIGHPPGAVSHFVTVCGNDDGPVMVWPPEDDNGAHFRTKIRLFR